MVILLGFHAGNFAAFLSPLLPGVFNGLSAGSYDVMDCLPDGLSDEFNDIGMERYKNTCRYFHNEFS